MRWSIEHKLPLFATILLVAVAIAQLTIGYGEVRQASLALADKRLPLATKVVADWFKTGQGRVRITALAKDPAIVAFLRSGGRSGREAALAAMHRITTDTASNAGLELRNFSGKLLLRTGRFSIADSVLVSPGKDSARYGPLLRRDTTLFIAVAAASGDAERAGGGIVQQVARLSLSDRTRATLTGLAGGDVTLLLGNAAGDPWTDFATIVPAPPPSVLRRRAPVRYERGEVRRAREAGVEGDDWGAVAVVSRRRRRRRSA